jgi:hypothetical protein
MKLRSRLVGPIYLLLGILLCQVASFNALADGRSQRCQVLIANQLFDGVNFPQANMAVLIEADKVKQIGTPDQLRRLCRNKINLGDATILPGFIESHAHITFQNVRKDNVLEHGITTAQDTGGPLMAPEGGNGALRLLSVGPIIQAPDGYPLNIFAPLDPVGGYDKIGFAVSSPAEAQGVVDHLVTGGATAIKISLEHGDTLTEFGAPWLMPHDGPVPGQDHWHVLSDEIVEAIVDEAHNHHKRVIAHVGEQQGFDQALRTGVDEFAHMPCAEISTDSLRTAANKPGLTFVTTIDTLSSCVNTSTGKGIHSNAEQLALFIEECEGLTPGHCAQIIYGSEIAHDNVPWGINGEEMHMMLHLTHGAGNIDFNDVVNVFRSVTSKAGEHLGLAPLGTLTPGAPADIIAVKGNPFERFKILEYPDLVMSGGKIIINKF